MSAYRHYIVGILSNRTQAEKLFAQAVVQGVPYQQLRIFDKYAILPKTEAVLETGLDSLLGVKILAKDVSLIVEHDLIPQLVSLGWGASLGVVGSNFYTREDTRLLIDLVHDAVLSRQIVLVIEATSIAETEKMSELLQATISDLSDVI